MTLTIKQWLISLTAILLGSLILSIAVNWSFSNTLQQANHYQQKSSDAMILFSEVKFYIAQIQQYLTDVAATGERDAISDAEKHMELTRQNLDALKNLLPAKNKTIDILQTEVDQLYQTGIDMINAYINSGRDAGNAIMKRPETGFDDLALVVTNDLKELIKDLKTDYDLSNIALTNNVKQSKKFSIIINIIIFILGAIGLTLLFIKIIPPIEKLSRSLHDLNQGEGDLSRRLPVNSQDEVAEIIRSFNQFIDHLQHIIKQIIQSTEPLANAAQQVSVVSHNTNAGAEKQQIQTQGIVHSISEISSSIDNIADHAATAMKSSQEAESKAQDGHTVVENTVLSINELAAEVNRAADVIQRLEEYSDKIGSVLDVIKGIAEQTNLLALNAAIEAARAGEQGRGFAVVADEVRTLAGRTQQSTQEIQEMIERLQGAAREAVNVMANGHEKAQTSVTQASHAGSSLQDILHSISSIREMNAYIADTSEKQSVMVNKINNNIIEISHIAEQTSGSTHQLNSESEALVKQANQLENLVRRFKV